MSANFPNFPENTVAAGFPGPTYLASLEGDVQSEFQAAYGQVEGWMATDHNADGTHKNVRALTIESEMGILSGSGTLHGDMPQTFASGCVISLINATGAQETLAGFFGIASSRADSGARALESYAYTNLASPETSASIISAAGVAQHDGTGTVTSLIGIQSSVEHTSSGGGTESVGFLASMFGRQGLGTGTYTNAVAFDVGTFGTGYTNKYSFRSTDSTATFSHAGPISVTGTAYFAGDLVLEATKKFYLDGVGGAGGDTYWTEASANRMQAFVGAAMVADWLSTDVSFPPIYASTTAAAADVNVASDGTLRRSTSSLKYKTKIKPITANDARALLKLDCFSYSSKSACDDPKRRFIGFSAEQMHEVAPEFCTYGDTGEPEGVDYARMVVYLTRLVQDLLK